MGLSLVFPLVSAGCAKRATPDECRKACEHVADLELAPLRKQAMIALHELDERVESIEDQSKKNLEQLRRDLAAGGPPWDQKALAHRHLSAAALRDAKARHAAEAAALRQQQEAAIRQDEALVSDEKKKFVAAKQKADGDVKKATADAVVACAEKCVGEKRSAAAVACLLRTQAIEDFKICVPN